jgi:competence protein ComEC
MLALGDLGKQTQQMLAGAVTPSLRPVEVVKVSHHGSADQHLELYRTLAAPVALIGVGADNGYGHPAATILDELTALGTTIGRSDAHGLVLIERDDDGLRVWRERDTSVTPAN